MSKKIVLFRQKDVNPNPELITRLSIIFVLGYFNKVRRLYFLFN